MLTDSGSSCGSGGVLLKFSEILDPAIDAFADRVKPGRLISIELLGGNEEAATIDRGSDPRAKKSLRCCIEEMAPG
jgi:hypothetical protein